MDIATIVLAAVTLLSVLTAVEAVVERRSLRRRVEALKTRAPVDLETGLANRESFAPRVDAEFKRAQRCAGKSSLGVWIVREGDPVAFGAALRESLDFAATGFRLGEDLFAVVTTAIDEAADERFAASRRTVAECIDDQRVDGAIAVFPDEGESVDAIMAVATRRLAPTAPVPIPHPDAGGGS